MTKRVLACVAHLALASSLWSPAESSTLRVPEDYPTILAAVDVAVSGDTVLVGPGVWTRGEDRGYAALAFPTGGVTIASTDGAANTTLDISELGPISAAIYVSGATEPVVVDGFRFVGRTTTLENSVCILAAGSEQLIVKNSIFEGNETAFSAGEYAAVYAASCTLHLLDCVFVENAGRGAGIVTVWNSDLLVEGCLFERNIGILLSAGNDTRSWVVRDSVFRMNTSARCVMFQGGGGSVTGCRFEENSTTGGAVGSSVWIGFSQEPSLVEFCTVVRDFADGGSGAFYVTDGDAVIRNCTFVGCHAPFVGGAAVLAGPSATALVEQCVFANTTGREPLGAFDGTVSSNCNVFWNNQAGDYWNVTPGALDFPADPQFCDESVDNYAISATSPCASDLSPCGQIGAFGVGCGPLSIERASWSSIKSLYR